MNMSILWRIKISSNCLLYFILQLLLLYYRHFYPSDCFCCFIIKMSKINYILQLVRHLFFLIFSADSNDNLIKRTLMKMIATILVMLHSYLMINNNQQQIIGSDHVFKGIFNFALISGRICKRLWWTFKIVEEYFEKKIYAEQKIQRFSSNTSRFNQKLDLALKPNEVVKLNPIDLKRFSF